MIGKILFALLGICSLSYIVYSYGLGQVAHDFNLLGWWLIPIMVSFLPVALCYSMAWLLSSPLIKITPYSFLQFTKYTVIGIAWNNLSPFVKILGEPVRANLLSKSISPKQAIKSVVIYNIAHLIGTILSFILGSLLILAFYPVPDSFFYGIISLIFISISLIALILLLPKIAPKNSLKHYGWYPIVIKVRWAISRTNVFMKDYRLRFLCAVFLETIARFVEGLTFYIAFIALGEKIDIFSALLLDVGRALLDNLFFFIPYQVGSREASVLLLTKSIMKIEVQSVLIVVLLYRAVEIFWMIIGYLLWIFEKKSSSDRT
ncbi:MAG: flippase-like domain-containing protein [Oligoflexia bacterium]|nr:flippase-like domain-containing protein [Oligoflexia bacterium]